MCLVIIKHSLFSLYLFLVFYFFCTFAKRYKLTPNSLIISKYFYFSLYLFCVLFFCTLAERYKLLLHSVMGNA